MAEQAVDLALRRLGRAARPCRTHETELRAARPLEGTIAEQARQAVREEMAGTLLDAVLRRMDLGTAGRPEPGSLDEVASVMAAELGWDAARVDQEKRSIEGVWN